jgi:hypothetical protein
MIVIVKLHPCIENRIGNAKMTPHTLQIEKINNNGGILTPFDESGY